jgi:hypothetical protein
MNLSKPLVLFSIASLLSAQSTTPSASGGQILQLASQYAIAWVDPLAAQNIVLTKAGLNWKTLAVNTLLNAPMFTALGGIAKIISIPTKASEGLLVGQGVVNAEVLPPLKLAQPNPNAIMPLLTIQTSMAPSAGACAGNSIFASSMQGQTATAIVAHAKKKGASASPAGATNVVTIGPVAWQGMMVSFTAQPIIVAKRIDGTSIKDFMPVSVVVCLPPGTLAPVAAAPQGMRMCWTDGATKTLLCQGADNVIFRPDVQQSSGPTSKVVAPSLIGPYPQCWTASEDGNQYCKNIDGLIFRPDLPAGTPNVVHQGAVLHINPDVLADGVDGLRAALSWAVQSSKADPENPHWYLVMAGINRLMGDDDIAAFAERMAARMPTKLNATEIAAAR